MYICKFCRLIGVLFLIFPTFIYAQSADFAGSGAFALSSGQGGKVEAVHLGSDVRMHIEGLTNRLHAQRHFQVIHPALLQSL